MKLQKSSYQYMKYCRERYMEIPYFRYILIYYLGETKEKYIQRSGFYGIFRWIGRGD